MVLSVSAYMIRSLSDFCGYWFVEMYSIFPYKKNPHYSAPTAHVKSYDLMWKHIVLHVRVILSIIRCVCNSLLAVRFSPGGNHFCPGTLHNKMLFFQDLCWCDSWDENCWKMIFQKLHLSPKF